MDDDSKSRTQKKNEARALQKLGEQLVALSSEQLERIDISDDLRNAVIVAGKTKSHGARRRQLQYIGTLMRNADLEPIQNVLENIRLGDYQKILSFKKIEKWRDELKEGNRVLIEEILNNYPDAERQRLTQLARNARNEYKAGKGVKFSKILFRYLNQISGVALFITTF
ncbi:MAG: ribosome biogenesis factor YjgA [Thermodesulfobacteriota bacterium]|nr:ribosome biogenesis factor YjgA [Thermodesulfobacteriota bacterium]